MAVDHNEMRAFEEPLDQLFARYRDACPDPEPSVNFMPGLWQKIEARQTLAMSIGRFAKGFITAAAAICVLMAIFLAVPQNHNSLFYSATYVETLADDPHAESALAYADILQNGSSEGLLQ